MDTNFEILHRILQATGMRQKVIASNIANADTPGYKAKDVKFGNILGRQLGLATTAPGHISGADSGTGGSFVIEKNPSWGDGNNVELDIEVAKMTENALVHDAALKILSTKIKMFRAAVRSK